jgi:hypothetical protein
MSDIKKITDFFSGYFDKFSNCFSIKKIENKNWAIRKTQIKMDVDEQFEKFKYDLIRLPINDHVTLEIEQLIKNLQEEILDKNKNVSISSKTWEAIDSNFQILESKLSNSLKEYQEQILNDSEPREKFSDVKLKSIEISLFILLASKFGIISNNEVTDTEKAKCFSKLTNFSQKSIRNFITGEYKLKPELLKLKKDNINDLKKVIDNISQYLDSMYSN